MHPWLAAHLAQPIAGQDRRGLLDAATLAQLRAVYFGSIAELDHHLGRILERLARRGDLERTLVVVTSDHGEMLGDHWMLGKAGFFPQAFHVPLLIRQPGGARGRRVTALTEHVDLMPTVLQALDLSVPRQCDGRSLSEFLTAEPPRSWRDAAHWEHDFRDVATGTYERALGLTSDGCGLAVRFDGRCGYVHFSRSAAPLLCRRFDLAARSGG